MYSGHYARNRVAIILVCFIALLTARDIQQFSRQSGPQSLLDGKSTQQKHHSTTPGTPVPEHYADENLTPDGILQSFCAMEGNAHLPLCSPARVAPTQIDSRHAASPELAISPNAFPQASDFVPVAEPSYALHGAQPNPEGIQPETEQGSLYWTGPFVWSGGPQGSSTSTTPAGQNGTANSSTPQNGVSIPEPGSLPLLLTGMAAVVAWKIRSIVP